MDTAQISALTALIAVIVAPYIQLKVTKTQGMYNIVSANRIRWIESLRDDIAKIIALNITLIRKKTEIAKLENDFKINAIASGDLDRAKEHYTWLVRITNDDVFAFNTTLSSLRMRLKAQEPGQNQVRCLLQSLKEAREDGKVDEAAKLAIELEDATQKFLRAEWRKVKELQ